MKRIAGAVVASGLLVGAGLVVAATPAAAATSCTGITTNAACGPTKTTLTKTLHPYAAVSTHATYGTWGIGATDPNQPDSTLCLIVAIDHTGSGIWLSDTDSGNVLSAGGTVHYLFLDQTLATVPACTINSTPVTTAVSTTQTAGHVKVTLAQTTQIDRGIKAGNAATYTVSHPSGATVTTTDLVPTLTSTSVSNPAPTLSVVTISNVNPIISKPLLDKTACVLEEDDTTATTGPWIATPGPWTGTYVNCPETAGQNTLKGSGVTIDVAGGTGAVSVDFVQSSTSGVQLWSQLLGVCKISDQNTRAITCKGDWGTAIPLAIQVRDFAGVTGGSPYGNPAGLPDAQGVTTPATDHISGGFL